MSNPRDAAYPDGVHPDGEHPDDEQLSAYLDGAAADAGGVGGLDGHETCPDCMARLDALGRAAAWIGSPPAASPSLDAAIARALSDAASTGDYSSRSSSPTTLLADRRKPDFARRRLLAGLAAAAVVVIALGSVTMLRSHDNTKVSNMMASGGDAESPIANGGDLGEQADPLALATAVRVALTGTAGPMAGTAADSAATGGGTSGAGQPPAPIQSQAPSAESREAVASALTVTTSNKPPTRACIAASSAASGGGVLVYSATLKWKGEPAVALGYHLSSGSLAYRLVVMSRPACRLLVVQSF